jgi:hypothetical protein
MKENLPTLLVRVSGIGGRCTYADDELSKLLSAPLSHPYIKEGIYLVQSMRT